MRNTLLLALCFSTLTLQAASIPFPTGLVPFNSIANETTTSSIGDFLVLGYTNPALQSALQSIPLPSSPNESFSDAEIQLAPGRFFSSVFVPTAAQRFGDYSAFSQRIIDPLTGAPFPGNIIPASRLFGNNGLYAFQVGPQSSAATPEPSALSLLLTAGLATALAMALRKLRTA